MKVGSRVTALYDIEPDAWYFSDNPAAAMPSCVLMEIALQPCGWLASYTLSRPDPEKDLLFRNLDGEATQFRAVMPDDVTIKTEAELVSVSKIGEMILEKFSVRCSIAGENIFSTETVFGFFPPHAMLAQKGFSGCRAAGEDCFADFVPLELGELPRQLFGRSRGIQLPTGRLLRIDRITGFSPAGGRKKLGLICAEKMVDPKDWCFKSHFFQDPVQPGSLGLEGILQTVQAMMLLKGLDAGIDNPQFEPVLLGKGIEWHYRGQVTPENQKIYIEFEASEQTNDTNGISIVGEARFWVDDLLIYQAPVLHENIPASLSISNG
jgi:3-hydroxymyristoyl/3-hydroxydecanoyl-(acyl carrier protein) dehydratase